MHSSNQVCERIHKLRRLSLKYVARRWWSSSARVNMPTKSCAWIQELSERCPWEEYYQIRTALSIRLLCQILFSVGQLQQFKNDTRTVSLNRVAYVIPISHTLIFPFFAPATISRPKDHHISDTRQRVVQDGWLNQQDDEQTICQSRDADSDARAWRSRENK